MNEMTQRAAHIKCRLTIFSFLMAGVTLILKRFGYDFIEKHFLGENAWGPMIYLYCAIALAALTGLALAVVAIVRRERWTFGVAAGLLNVVAWLLQFSNDPL
jgi:hypothetical protein